MNFRLVCYLYPEPNKFINKSKFNPSKQRQNKQEELTEINNPK